MIRSFVLAGLALAGVWAAAPSPAQADTKLYIPNCTALPCFIDVPVYIDRVGTAVVPWVAQLSFTAGNCLLVTQAGADATIDMRIVSPDGLIYRQPNGNSQIQTVAKDGWYTIAVYSRPPATEQIGQIRIRQDTSGACGSNVPPL